MSTLLNNLNATSGSTNVDSMKQNAVLACSILNRVDCSNLPVSNCSLLKRQDCLLTDNTCGPCISGYVGVEGHDNTACLTPAQMTNLLQGSAAINSNSYPTSHLLQHRRMLTLTSCTNSSQCDHSEVCMDGLCTFPSKKCPNNCSGHGICEYVSTSTGQRIDDCHVGSFLCLSQCKCEQGYNLESCSVTDAELQHIQLVREAAANNLATVMMMEDANRNAITGWVSSLMALSRKTDQLSSNTASGVQSMILHTLTAATSSGGGIVVHLAYHMKSLSLC